MCLVEQKQKSGSRVRRGRKGVRRFRLLFSFDLFLKKSISIACKILGRIVSESILNCLGLIYSICKRKLQLLIR